MVSGVGYPTLFEQELKKMNIQDLQTQLAKAENRLTELETEECEILSRIEKIKCEINKIEIQLAAESLPTGLYNQGFKLKFHKYNTFLLNIDEEVVREWEHEPSLGELFEAEKELVK